MDFRISVNSLDFSSVEDMAAKSYKKSFLRQEQKMRDAFDFGADTVMTIEKIITSCYLNPMRTKFAAMKIRSTDGTSYQLSGNEISAQLLLQKFRLQMPNITEKFDNKMICVTDVKNIKSDINSDYWQSGLKDLRWYGPYTMTKECIFFKSVSDCGVCFGFTLWVFFD